MEHIDFYKQFPLLIPESLDPLKANGYIEVAEGVRVQVSIDATVTRGTYGTNVVKSTPDITQFLCGKKHELDARFQQCTSGLAFAKELQHSLASISSEPQTVASKRYQQIVSECDDRLGWDNVESFDKSAQIMTINLKDSAERRHRVYANFESSTFSSDVEERTTSMEGITLTRYIALLKHKCEQLQECWDLLDDVDSTLCVLQPQHPKRFELWRRIAVSNLATALVETSPDRLVPKIIVYGPSSTADLLNSKARAAHSAWDGTKCVRTNIETMLELQLPEKLSFDQQDLKLDCGICFAFNSNGETADQLCTSDMCAQPFHRTCLVQWLASKEDTRQSLTTLFGKCPYCSGKVTVNTTS